MAAADRGDPRAGSGGRGLSSRLPVRPGQYALRQGDEANARKAHPKRCGQSPAHYARCVCLHAPRNVPLQCVPPLLSWVVRIYLLGSTPCRMLNNYKSLTHFMSQIWNPDTPPLHFSPSMHIRVI